MYTHRTNSAILEDNPGHTRVSAADAPRGCWAKKRLAALGLKRRNVVETRLTIVHQAIKNELQTSNCCLGYRSIISTVMIATRRDGSCWFTAMKIKTTDKENLHEQGNDFSAPFSYFELRDSLQGPNWCWHIDGYDKLKAFGFPIHACIDGFSQKIIWLELTSTNTDPSVVVKFFLDAVVKLEDSRDSPLNDSSFQEALLTALKRKVVSSSRRDQSSLSAIANSRDVNYRLRLMNLDRSRKRKQEESYEDLLCSYCELTSSKDAKFLQVTAIGAMVTDAGLGFMHSDSYDVIKKAAVPLLRKKVNFDTGSLIVSQAPVVNLPLESGAWTLGGVLERIGGMGKAKRLVLGIYMPEDSMDPVHIGSIAKQIARALAYMHSRDPIVIHQDLKPANVMNNLATVKTSKGSGAGTAPFKAPEMFVDAKRSCQGVGAGINMQPAYLSSAAHLEPVFMYKGEMCTGKFVFIRAKGYEKIVSRYCRKIHAAAGIPV
eukprot:Em0300g3a